MMTSDCNQFDMIKEALHLSNVVINNVSHEEEEGISRIVVDLRPTDDVINCCPHCGNICDYYDTPRPNDPPKTWRSLDFANKVVVLKHKPHRVLCPTHGVVTAYVPWAYPHACFTRAFDQQAVWLTTHMSKSAVSNYLRITWGAIGRCISRVKKDFEPDSSERLNGLVRIGIDENAYGRGHNKFIMIVVNHDTNEVVWAKEGRSKEVIASFFESLTEVQRSTIELVSADGAEWIHDVVKQYCPNAKICIDTFHVFEWITEAQNAVRLQEYRKKTQEIKKLKEEKKEIKESSDDFSRAQLSAIVGELNVQLNEANADAALIKSSFHLFNMNNENLSNEDQLRLNRLVATSPVLARVSSRVALFRDIVHTNDLNSVEGELDCWIGWAMRSRLDPFKKLAQTLKRFRDPILNTIKFGLNNARVEANNNIIKALIRRSYGFSNVQNLIDLIMIVCSRRYIVLPDRGLGEKGKSRWRVYRTNQFVAA